MEANLETVSLDWKTAGQRVRRTMATSGGGRMTSFDNESERPLHLTQHEAMQLLTLCVSSPSAVGLDEDGLLEKLANHVRRF